MGIKLGDVFVALRAKDDQLDADLSRAKGKVGGFASGLTSAIGNATRGAFERVGQIGTELVLNAAKQAVEFTKESIDAASNLNESISKVNVVFGDSANEIQDWARTASTAFGQSRQQALEAAGTFGNLFSALGLNQGQAKDMSLGLVQLASDLASFNNIEVDEALIKLRAGIVGETEPLRTLGVNLSAAAVEAYALKNGLAASKDEITEQDKVTARYAIILEQTTLAQGDFARTSTGLANSQRILKAQWTDIKATVGTALLPVITQAAGIFSRLATAVMPSLAAFLEEKVVPAMQHAADAMAAFVENSKFEWNPQFKQIKLGDLFEFIQSDEGTQINLADYVTFIYDAKSGAVALTLGDVFSFVSDAGGTVINLQDYVRFVYDTSSGGVALTLGDVFSFVQSGDVTTINLQDYVRFFYDAGIGKVLLTVADVFSFESDEGGTVINLNDYVRFTYDADSGGVALTLGDVFSFVQAGDITTINLQDYVRFTWGDGETKKLTLGDFFDFSNKEGVSIVKFDLQDFLWGDWDDSLKVTTQEDLFDFGQKVKTAAYSLADFFGWSGAGEKKIGNDDLFDLSGGEKPRPFALSDFFGWMGADVVKITYGDLFDLTVGKGIDKLQIGDFINLESVSADALFGSALSELSKGLGQSLADAASSLGKALDAPQWVQDLINWKPSDGGPGWVTALLAWDLSSASAGLGQALEKAAAGIAESLGAPPWVADLMNWKPDQDGPAWVASLVAFKFPEVPAVIANLLAWAWPGSPTEIGDILTWVWPDVPASITTLVSWVWPEFSAAVTSAINRITSFKFPELKAPAWLDRLTNFSIPAPQWVTNLLNWTPSLPTLPSWLGGGGADASSSDGRSSLGRSALSQPVTVNLGPVYVNSQEDAEAIAYNVARRLGGR